MGYTEINPAYGLLKKILPPKNNRNLTEPDPFNREDLGAFLEAAWAKLSEPFPLILEVMAMSGMRLGESFYAGAGAMNVDRVILAVHISAKFARMDRFEIIEEIGSILYWFGQMFGQDSARRTKQKA